MATSSLPLNRRSRRLATVEEHVRLENAHDLEGVIQTFGEMARYDDEPWDQHYEGRQGVRLFYEQLMAALPDLNIEIVSRHVAEEAVILEVVIRGTHSGGWRGLPATGRRVEFQLCGVYTFDGDERLAGEKIYYDRGMVLKQLGVFHEPQSAMGQFTTLLTHAVTILRALGKNLFRK
ncbi:MAG TPA: ester cyclase [Candidatus Saccharimonadales bacterium]|nr:ester cyclase [Candidatus Saccharimonadales bacterium]